MTTNDAKVDNHTCTTLCENGLDQYRRALRTGELTGRVPKCLVELGLLHEVESDRRRPAGTSARYLPVPPAIAVANLVRPMEEAIAAQRSELEGLTAAFAPLEDIYHHEQRQRESHVQHLVGEDTVIGTIKMAIEACDHEVLTAQPCSSRRTGAIGHALPHELDPARRGVRQRSLCGHTLRSHGPTLARAARLAQAGGEIRTVGVPFEPLIICDRAIAYIPVPPPEGPHPHALVVREPGLVEHFVRTFEALWERAEPLAVRTRPHRAVQLTGEVQRTVLELMVKGHTDLAISKRLGLSVRTIGTHIKRASECLHSHSRAELGYRLAQSGVLEAGSSPGRIGRQARPLGPSR